ncbi:MAG: FAD-dependent oxidoreductase [Ruminococcus sp.]|nr:FAD-dependent oxidoreductase [Ruminococcus sp.]
MGQRLCTKSPLPKEAEIKKITDPHWSKKDWDVDYRENREDVVSTGTAPCKTACPAHIGIQGYIKLAAQGKYRDALELIKRENPFPAVCGRICNRRCESECTHGEVDFYCLESAEEMPALKEEVDEALEEGIQIHNGWGPKEVKAEDGSVTGLVLKKCVSVFGKDGRFQPVYEESEIQEVSCDQVLTSIGQSIQWGELLEGSKVEYNPNGTAKADSFTYQTAQPDVFVGGDAYTGPRFCIDAITVGKEAAISLHRYVQPGQSLTLGRDRRHHKALDKKNLDLGSFDSTPRQKPAVNTERAGTFHDSRKTFTEEQVRAETARCLGCGATKVDQYLCIGCGQCTTKCKFDAISLERRYDVQFGAFEQMPIEVAKYAVKRTGKIIAAAARRE